MTNEEYYAMLDRARLCHRCHKEKAFPGRKFCPECLEERTLNNARYCERARANPETAQKQRDWHNSWYHQHKDAGLCVRCNKPATHGRNCYEHYIQMKRYIRNQTEKRRRDALDRVNIRDYRRKNHLCCYCGAPIEEGNPTQACDACRERQAEFSRLADKTLWKSFVISKSPRQAESGGAGVDAQRGS